MAKITAADISKLRKETGAGIMNCKKALNEADGDFDKAREIIRERGQSIAKKREDREASEGAVIAKTSDDNKKGVVVCLNSETDFVAKNSDFIELAGKISELALDKLPENIDTLSEMEIDGKSVKENIKQVSGMTGEKVVLGYYDKLEGEFIVPYIHMNNSIGTIVAANKETDFEVIKNIAMQVAAMNPVALDKDSVPQKVLDQEMEIGRQQAKNEGKPDELVDKIAMGKVNKFIKENTLLTQPFVRDNKKSVSDYLKENDKELTITGYKRWSLS